ncbi:unnamed protein product, partial [Adineta steineri]
DYYEEKIDHSIAAFCKLIANDNETISYTPQITLLNTKIINRTANLISDKLEKSIGIWQTNFIDSELSDQNLYNRKGEVNLHTILFISLVLELFCLTFFYI